jgi:hypothetical protein
MLKNDKYISSKVKRLRAEPKEHSCGFNIDYNIFHVLLLRILVMRV